MQTSRPCNCDSVDEQLLPGNNKQNTVNHWSDLWQMLNLNLKTNFTLQVNVVEYSDRIQLS